MPRSINKRLTSRNHLKGCLLECADQCVNKSTDCSTDIDCSIKVYRLCCFNHPSYYADIMLCLMH